MNQEIKQKLEQAAELVVMKLYNRKPSEGSSELNEFNEFKSVAIEASQTILENPADWGLVTAYQYYANKNRYEKHLVELCDKEILLESQLTKYREALEKLADKDDADTQDFEGVIKVAKEALKQQ